MTEHAAPANAPPPLVDHGSTVDLRADPVGFAVLARHSSRRSTIAMSMRSWTWRIRALCSAPPR